MVSLDLEKKIFHMVIENPKYWQKVESQYFENKDIRLLYRFAQAFVKKFGRPPSKDQLNELIRRKGREDILPPERVKIIFEAKDAEYDHEYLDRVIKAWAKVKGLHRGMGTAIEYFKSQEINEENAQSICGEVVNIINTKGLVSFHESSGVDFFDAESHYYDEDEQKSPWGYPFLDTVTDGGISPGNLWCFIGETNIGKSLWLCNFAKRFMDQGSNVAYISCEMDSKKVIRRIGSNAFDVPVREYFDWAMDSERVKNAITRYREDQAGELLGSELGKLIIEDFPTSTLTVPNLESFLVDNVEQSIGEKIDVVIVDYINIMENWRNPNSENIYMKIKQLAEDLRAMAAKNNWAVITATQLKIGAYGASALNIQDAAESSGLGHTVDGMVGIIQSTQMKAMNQYKLQILKWRDGGYKGSSKLFEVLYNRMRISEDENSGILEG